MNVYELQPRFTALFSGLDTAFGTGRGQWIKRPPRPSDWVDHLSGRGPGLGIAPLRPDSTVKFAAIDLDEPDFDAAREMQKYIPGASFIERSRSGNAHCWCFFREPIDAWVPMGILRAATEAAGKDHVEVFPKNWDFSRVRLGSYVNLPYHGDNRPIVTFAVGEGNSGKHVEWTLEGFLNEAHITLNDSQAWKDKARWLGLEPPAQRETKAEFGTQPYLHRCAEYLIENAEDNPVVKGHRAVVYFSLAKMLTNWSQIDHDEALDLMRSVNDCSAPHDRVSDGELRRILGNAERGQFTSFGCDDPVFAPYADPTCRIANPRR